MLKWVRQFVYRDRSVSAPALRELTIASATDLIEEGNALLDPDAFAAENFYRKAIAIEPANAEAHYQLGITLRAAGKAQQAEQHLANALSLDPTMVEAHYALGDLAREKNLTDVAETHWRKALDLAPDFEVAYLALCRLLVATGALGAARQLVSYGIAQLPTSAGLHFYLGNLQFQDQQYDTAAESYRHALAEQPQHSEILANLGLALLQLDQENEAVASLQAALAIDPDMVGGWHNLGNAYVKLQQLDSAADAFRHAVALESHNADAHFNLGNVLYSLDRIDEATDAYRLAATLAPEREEIHGNLGSALLRQGNGTAAIESLRRALALSPSSVMAYHNLGTALQSRGRLDEAIEAYRAALAVEPAHVESLFNLGILLETRSDMNAALACYQQATALNPMHAAAHCNLGRIFQAQHKLEEALACYRKALHADNDFTVARMNMSDVFISQNRFNEAIACYAAILATNPNHVDVHVNNAMALLTTGDYRAGWREFEYRWNLADTDAQARPTFSQREWNGQEDIAGQTILLYAEQGLGDTLQFIRYASLVAERGAIVHILAPQTLQTIVASCAGVAAVFTPNELPAQFDRHCALMSLPLLFGTDLSSIPATVPYLAAAPEKIHQWQTRLSRFGREARLRVGLVWAGNPRKGHHIAAQAADRMRSLHFKEITPLLEIKDVEFFSLQLGDEAIAQMQGDSRVIDLTEALRDFEDTAALIANLDLVISVDTSVVHLAGAIGKPVWVLNRYNSCWRWLTERSDSPWYPTARIFRQPSFGDWASVIVEAGRALDELATATRKTGVN